MTGSLELFEPDPFHARGLSAMYISRTATNYAAHLGIPNVALPLVQATADGTAARLQGGNFHDVFRGSLAYGYGLNLAQAGIEGLGVDEYLWLDVTLGKFSAVVNTSRYVAAALVSGSLDREESFLQASLKGAAGAIGGDAGALISGYGRASEELDKMSSEYSRAGTNSLLQIDLIAAAVSIRPRAYSVDVNAAAAMAVRYRDLTFDVEIGPFEQDIAIPRYPGCRLCP